MSKRNVSLSEGWTADDLHEDNKSPKHLSMRMRLTKKDGRVGRYDYVYPDSSWTRQKQMLRYIPKMLEKNIGKSFNDVFSMFCKKYPEYVGDLNSREEFRKFFVEYAKFNYWRAKASFYIDDQGRICSYKKNPRIARKRKNLTFYTQDPVYYYRLNKDFLKKHKSIDNVLYNVLGYDLYQFMTTEEKLTESFRSKVIDILSCRRVSLLNAAKEDGLNYHYYDDIYADFFIKETDTPEMVLKKGSDEYKQYKKEESDRKKVAAREYQKEREERYEAMLRLIREKQEEERKKNIIDRDRLGFDDKSFKKEKEE